MIDSVQLPLLDIDVVLASVVLRLGDAHFDAVAIRGQGVHALGDDVRAIHGLTQRAERIVRRWKRYASSVHTSIDRYSVIVGAVHEEHVCFAALWTTSGRIRKRTTRERHDAAEEFGLFARQAARHETSSSDSNDVNALFIDVEFLLRGGDDF